MEYRLIEVDSGNAEDFSSFLDDDMKEQLGREFFRGIGALDENGGPQGVIVYELKNYSSEKDTTSRIRHLSATDEEAKNAILNEYASRIREDQVVESFYESPDKTLAQYLESNGFSMQVSEALNLVVRTEEIQKIPQILKGKKIPPYIKSISEITILQYRSFVKECLFKGYTGLMDDLAYIPKNWFETDVSACVVTDEKVKGCLLIKKSPSGLLFTMLFTAFGPDYRKNLGLMMAYSAQMIVENYADDAEVVIRRHSPDVRRLTDKFFAESKGDEVFSGTRTEPWERG